MFRLIRFFESRLQRRLVGIFLPLVVVPLLLISLFLGSQRYQSLIAAQDESEDSQIRQQLDEIDEYTEGLESDIRLLAALPTIITYGETLVNREAKRADLTAARAVAQSELLAFSAVRDEYYKLRFIDAGGQERIRIDSAGDGSPAVPVVENGLQYKGNRDFFENAARLPEGSLYVSPLDLNREGNPPEIELSPAGNVIPVIRYAMPVYVTNPATARKELAGVVVANAFAEPIFDIIREEADNDEYNLLLNAQGYFLYSNMDNARIFGFESGIDQVATGSGQSATIQAVLPNYTGALLNARDVTTLQENVDGHQDFATNIGDFEAVIHYTRITPSGASPENYWVLVNAQSRAVLAAELQALVAAGVIGLIVIVLAVSFIVNIFARTVTVPLEKLGQRANAMATGDLTPSTEDSTLSTRPDEVGTLGKAFSTMSTQLKDVLTSLESRVAARTADLQTASDIASAANQVREQADLISLMVNLIRDRFNFYYVQVYLLDDERKFAILKDGTGYVGRRLLARNHRLPMDGVSLVAKTIIDGRPTIVQDTAKAPGFRANDLLPETRAELVVPLRSREDVIGALDIQHNISDAFDPESLQLFQTLAEQLAVTFENVKLFEDTERRARELETVALVGIEATRNLDVKALLRSVSKLTRDNFGLYHAHIYLLNDAGDELILTGGAGEVGTQMVEQGHHIALNHPASIVARAARTGEVVIVNDTVHEPNFLPNPLLPDTRSEMAVPLLIGDKVIGVLDTQASDLNHFDEEDVRIKTTLASQVAVAVQNARTFLEVQMAQKETERIFTSTLDLLGSANLNGYFTRLNPAWELTLGYTAEELMGPAASRSKIAIAARTAPISGLAGT
jgi:GAF domain-containing protein/HAMP domain-containing protein